MIDQPQLRELAKKIPDRFIKQKPGAFAADYVSHSEITQILLSKHGPVTQRVVEVIRNPDGIIDGCILEMEFTIDGRDIVIQEVGDVERPGSNNGSNLKNAVSDAVKRCAMRGCGLGLHLWAQENWVLEQALAPRVLEQALAPKKDSDE
jgi:hypothetical protein